MILHSSYGEQTRQLRFAMSAFASKATFIPAVGMSAMGSILLKKSVFPNEQNFPEALARPYENYMGGHIVRSISNLQPS
jgi:hypothetical protein